MSTTTETPDDETFSSPYHVIAPVLPLSDKKDLHVKGTKTAITQEWAAQSDENNVKAEEGVRRYYIMYGVCPPAFPNGYPRVTGGIYDNTKTSFLGGPKDPNRKEHVYAYAPTNAEGKRWPEILGHMGRLNLLETRKAEYDNAIRSGDRTAITTTWEGVPEETLASIGHVSDRGDVPEMAESTEEHAGMSAEGQQPSSRSPSPQYNYAPLDNEISEALSLMLKDWVADYDPSVKEILGPEEYMEIACAMNREVATLIRDEIEYFKELLQQWLRKKNVYQHFTEKEVERMAEKLTEKGVEVVFQSRASGPH